MNVSIIVLIFLIPLIFIVPILVGVYVYRDANKRGMNAVLWTLIALLAPSLLGLIIYLLVRSNYSDLTCPNCSTPVEESYIVCPNCRTRLRPTCPNCAAPVEPTWQVCPHCGETLPVHSGDVAAPVRAKDTTLKKILIALIVVPVALITLMIIAALLFSANTTEFDSHSIHFTTTAVEKYLAETTDTQQQFILKEWLSDSSISESNATSGNPECMVMPLSTTVPGEFTYIVYIPGVSGSLEQSLYPVEQGGLFSDSYHLELRLNSMDVPADEPLMITVTYQTSNVDNPPETLDIYYNNRLCNIHWYYTE